jgi:hypothetical protein
MSVTPALTLAAVVLITLSFAGSNTEVDYPRVPPSARELLALQRELHTFKDDPEFHQFGFGACCRFHDWLTRVRALGGNEGLDIWLWDHDLWIDAESLLRLGLEYMWSGGRSTSTTALIESDFEEVQDALGRSDK